MLTVAKRGLRWSLRGENFRRWTRPNPPAEPGPRLRIAVCFLIPLMGDVVMLFPLLDALRRDQPEAEISVFVSGMGSVLQLHPGVDHVYVRPKLAAAYDGFPNDEILATWRWWKRELRDLRFDVCVLPRGGSDPTYSAHLAWLLGGRRRVGFSTAVEPERLPLDMRSSALLTDEITELNGVHEVERGAEVLRRAGLLHGEVVMDHPSPSLAAIATSAAGREFVATHPELSRAYFVISPGASGGHKQWQEERFATVARYVMETRGWAAVIVGGPEVRAAGERMTAALDGRALNLAGRTDFIQLSAVSLGAQAFFGNDSGTGHVAGALGTPTVIVSSYAKSAPVVHQSSPARTRPAGPWVSVVQPQRPLPPCETECVAAEPHCIRQVEADEVLKAFDALTAQWARAEESGYSRVLTTEFGS